MADERDDEQDGGDLFDRWLAHREETTDDAPRPRTYGVPSTRPRAADGDPAEEPAEEPAEMPAGEPAEARAEGSAAEPALEPAPPSASGREPVTLSGFEPVVIASVRRNAEAPSQTRAQRRARRTGRAPEPVTGAPQEEPTPLHDEVAKEVPLPEPSPEPPPAPTPAPSPAPSPAPRPAPKVRRLRPALSSHVDAARTSLDRSIRGTAEERAAASTPGPQAAPTSTPAPSPAPAPVTDPPHSRSAYDELRAERAAAAAPVPDRLPPDLEFRPRTLARRVTSILLLLGLSATGIAGWRAYDSRVETDIGLAAILALATGIVWAVRAGSVPTRMSLRGGLLEVRSQAGRFVFEISSAHTRLESIGTPGRPGWRLLVHRRGLAPFAITAAMVDPHELMDALRYYRPEL